ncbi:hypothetical protein DL96DRAFT_1778640 [Flagelloscypha sp. PMI_526]|nr:hypothetical protein DL96DRAFT_1778640 [Flagelloscypha sp. PMI_526]
MPRRPAVRAPLPTSDVLNTGDLLVPQVSQNHILLRKHWKWANFSQFFFTFSRVVNLPDVTLNAIEDDLALGSKLVLPRIMARLLYTLAYDRKVTLDTWQTALRRQYFKRNPSLNPIGPEPPSESPYSSRNATPEPTDPKDGSVKPEDSRNCSEQPPATEMDNTSLRDTSEQPTEDHSTSPEQPAANDPSKQEPIHANSAPKHEDEEMEVEESKDWFDLDMPAKLDSLHLLTEWQFHNATKLRQMMHAGDGELDWRIAPIGYDAKANGYWFIGDRLWIQRSSPKTQKNLKRKRPPPKSRSSAKQPAKRAKTQKSTENSTGSRSSRSASENTSSGRGGRVAKKLASARLEAQAKELAQLARHNDSTVREASGARVSRRLRGDTDPSDASRSVGTRLSSRLRGQGGDEDGWQPIPKEWLQDESDQDGEGSDAEPKKVMKTGLEDDGNDDETSEEESEEEEEEEEPEEEPEELEGEQSLPANFVEWETIAVTLQEWEAVAEQWKETKYPAEKRLYKIIQEAIKIIVDELQFEEEVAPQRKRSSRVAAIQSAKQIELTKIQEQEEEQEKLGRGRRNQNRPLTREERAELRRKAAEEREEAEALAQVEDDVGEEEPEGDPYVEEEEPEEEEEEEYEYEEKPKRKSARGKANGKVAQNGRNRNRTTATLGAISKPQPQVKAPVKPRLNGHTNPLPTTSTQQQQWELACAGCRRTGINISDGQPIVICQGCRKYHHVLCIDRLDEQRGLRRRDWAKTQHQFICIKCRPPPTTYPTTAYPSPQRQFAPSTYNTNPVGAGYDLSNVSYPQGYGVGQTNARYTQQQPSYPTQHSSQSFNPYVISQQPQQTFYATTPDVYSTTTSPQAGYSQRMSADWNGAPLSPSTPYNGAYRSAVSMDLGKGYGSPTAGYPPTIRPATRLGTNLTCGQWLWIPTAIPTVTSDRRNSSCTSSRCLCHPMAHHQWYTTLVDTHYLKGHIHTHDMS